MEGNGTENSCNRTLRWLHQDNDAKPWLWKFSGCFSRPEQTLPLSPQTKEYMENKKAAVELKDIPSPLHVGSKLFPAVPLPDIHSLQQPKVQLSAVPKPARNSIIDAAKIWPNIPPPSTQPVPRAIPLCNGCGTKGMEKETSLLATSLGKAASNFGSPEVAVTGQVLETLPPIGVFWDIENCSVPSGRSATTVVQRIREKFFRGHREAEFICVCDISKENKEVIQELNNCQVTVAHINATAKNAADDKLRQSLRRFANTHTAPATVVLVSTDVNFALELSDLRHRHGFHIILVHKNQASEALLHHANELIRFEEFISDLPPRLPPKIPCHTLLYVYNLPANKDGKSISNRLRRLSDNCGGKVLSITGCSAILRFINQDSAERAQKRMENEDVFGNRIIVSFTPKHREFLETKSSNAIADKAKSPKKVKNTKLCLIKDTSEQSPSAKAMPGKGLQAHSVSATKTTNIKSLQELCRMESKTGSRNSEQQQGHGRLAALPNGGLSTSVPTLKNTGVTEPLYRNSQKKENLSSRSVSSSPVEKEREETVFQVSYPSAFSKLIASRQVSPLLTSQSWSPR
ncbi:Marf1 [Phodopus roborovskii]|uniref:Marf1 protein n=2 Tax=Phodopus roborovskii TaxID=109678 RepID=A0AAV0AAZ4_PHORO|nr:Marf1 [Phodopus roborovskii]